MASPQRLGSAGTLIGRGAEQRAIGEAVQAARTGRPGVVFVEGDAGMGKTALVRHALAQLPADTQVEQAQADELASDRPFELVRQLGSASTDCFESAMELLETWSLRQDEGPVVVVVEDLHWVDAESNKALLSAVQRLDQDRVVVLVTSRPGLHEGWERLRSDPERCRLVTLTPFDPDEVAQLASSSGVDLTPYHAERLHAHTGGHPLYVRTLLSELSATELRLPDGDLLAPLSLRSAVTARLSEAPEPARALAAGMAVLNQRSELPVVGRIAGVASPVEAFEELLATGFVRWDPNEPGLPVEFSHPLYRQAIYEDLSPSRRRDLHRVAAEGLSSRSALTHRVAAADGVDERLATELEAEARQELERGHKVAAARNFQWASSLSIRASDRERRLVDAACTYMDAGRLSRALAMRPDIESFGEGPGRSLVLGLLEWNTGQAKEAQTWLQQAVNSPVSDAPEGRGTTARALAELAEIHITLGQVPEAAQAASRALALASPHTSAERLATIHGALAEGHLNGAASGLARLRERLPGAAEEVAGDEVDLLVIRATLALYAGQTNAALSDLRAVVVLARNGFVPVELARCHRELATVLITLGEWDEALIQARTALSIAGEDRRGTEEAACHAVLATVLAYRGDFEQAESHVTAAADTAARLRAVEGVVMARIAMAAIAVARDEPEQVIEALEPLAAAAPMMAALTFWPALTSALIEAGRLEHAEESVKALEMAAAARRLAMEARLTGLLARLSYARGELDLAAQLFSQALASFGPDDPVLERALLLYAHGLLQRDRGDRTQALVTLRQAHQALDRLGAEPFSSRMEANLRLAGARPGRRLARSSRELTDREHDVAVLVAKGYTNPEAAAELYVSRKAIEYHLRNIYGKLGISSRRELRGVQL